MNILRGRVVRKKKKGGIGLKGGGRQVHVKDGGPLSYTFMML